MNISPMLAAIDFVGLLVLVIISILSFLLKKKEAEKEAEKSGPVSDMESDREGDMNDWQRQAPARVPPTLPQSARETEPLEIWREKREQIQPKIASALEQLQKLQESRKTTKIATAPPVRVFRPRPSPAAKSNAQALHTSDGAQAVAFIRDRRTVRQAFITSQVFGPPKALEQSL
jgi:hypothetical protein